MTSNVASMESEARTSRDRFASTLSVVTATLGWLALAIEGERSLAKSLGTGHRLAEALFLYLHFFTILTNIGIAVLMSVTVLRLVARKPLPPARLYNAALVYILVTCVTYELMLRSQWKPHGLQFATDTIIHDIVPGLVLTFWLGFAPRAGARWRDALWMLAYPGGYFAVTLLAGGLGEGYPYNFLDVDRLGYASVLVTAAVFLAIFYALGLMTTGLSMSWAVDRRNKG